jgi:quinohemoprotein ethanol dehydrogenase
MKTASRQAAIAAAAAVVLGVAGAVVAGQDKSEPKTIVAQAATESAPVKKVPSANPRSGDPEAIDTGKTLYFTWCVQCHGVHANGESRFGKYAGNLTIMPWGYKEYVRIVLKGRVQMMMPPWEEVMDEEAVSNIGAYLETLAQEGANWQ